MIINFPAPDPLLLRAERAIAERLVVTDALIATRRQKLVILRESLRLRAASEAMSGQLTGWTTYARTADCVKAATRQLGHDVERLLVTRIVPALRSAAPRSF